MKCVCQLTPKLYVKLLLGHIVYMQCIRCKCKCTLSNVRLDSTVTSGMTRGWMARGSHSLTCQPRVYQRMEWTRRGLLLRKSQVAWSVCRSVCLCVGHTGELCNNCWTDRDDVWGLNHVGPRNHVFDGCLNPPRDGALFRGMCPGLR